MGNLSGQIVSQIFSLKLKEIFSRIVLAEQHCNRHPKVRLPNGSSCRSFLQTPPVGGLVKVAAAIGPGPGEWPQDTACWNLKISKIRRL